MIFGMAGVWAGIMRQEVGNMFNKQRILVDPYAKALTGGAKWGEPQIRRDINPQKDYSEFIRRCAVGTEEF